MLVVDELKKNDPQLRLLAVLLAGGLAVLLAALWWIQVVSVQEYQSNLETQAFRTIRIPAVRGKIFDREGRVLAENRPRYNLSLYLDEFRTQFYRSYTNLLAAKKAEVRRNIAETERKLGRSLNKEELKQYRLPSTTLDDLKAAARARVVGNTLGDVAEVLGQPIRFDPDDFNKHYTRKRALPYPAMKNLDAVQIARFQERFAPGSGADLELESVRHYPNGTLAGHLLGYVLRDDDAQEGENSYFNYYLPDYRGMVGIEAGCESWLRGRAGEESVLVNSMGYRESKTIQAEPEPGQNVTLTLDLDIQRAAETALRDKQGPNARGAVVVMDVRTGDVLAMVSSPAFNPVFSENNPAQLTDEKLRPGINRATQENFAAGSIFKVVIGLAALEAGLNPEREYEVEADPRDPAHGYYPGRGFTKKDTAIPGKYNFTRAIERSSNSYFIQIGLQLGIDHIIALAKRFHFGERAGLPTKQETKGDLPNYDRIHHGWSDGDTANLCIGQGELAVTPLQIAVAYSAIANGGTVFSPRLVVRIAPQDASASEQATNFPTAVVRDRLGVSARSMRTLHTAMLAETEDVEGTGKAAVVGPQMRICGKTGTAQIQDSANRLTGWNYWFASFAPFENPRYAVVVLVQSESKGSGGGVCAPIAHDIYQAILQKQNGTSGRTLALAQ
jgi:penicillin-binding protein 2